MAWYRRLLNAVRPNRLSRDIDRELSFHLAERADDLSAEGLRSEDAAAEARRRFGNRTLVSEHVRDTDGFAWIDSIMGDVRYATRALVASPGFSLVAIVSLAFGIGANTAIFSLANSLMLKSLPVDHPEQLVHVHMDSVTNANFTNPQWELIRDLSADFAGSVAHAVTSFNLEKTGIERRANGAWVSGGFFAELGVRPVAGRLFAAADDVRGCPGTAVLSEGFAEREFGSAAQAVAKPVSLNGQLFDVIGVSDGRFFGLEVGRTTDIYVPLCAQTMLYGPNVLDHRSRWYIDILLRPREGISLAQMNARLAAIAPRVFSATVPQNYSVADQAEYQKVPLGATYAATGISDLRSSYRSALLTLMAIVGAVLLVACANIANLLLARAAARQREIAIRLAMGAGRWRLVRQLLTESVILAGIGASLGVLFAQWASRLLVGFLSTRGRPAFLDLSLDLRVLGFTIVVAGLTVTVFGLVPAFRATRVDPQLAMKSGRGVVGRAGEHRLGKSLVVMQVALSLALIAASALLLGSFRKLVTLDPGFRRDGVLLVTMKFRNANLKPEALLPAKRDVLTRLRATPGVTSASASVLTPIGSMSWNDFIAVSGYAPTKSRDSLVYINQVSDGYFNTLGSRLMGGRDFTAGDIDQQRRVALVNETMAHQVFPNGTPVGQTLRLRSGDTLTAPWEVIGVVQDAKYLRLSEKTLPTLYFPMGEGDIEGDQMVFQIRTATEPTSLIPAVRAVASAANPAISMDVTTFEEQVSTSLARPRLLATLSGFFGALALLLAVIGLYGTMSYNVTRRRNEIGIRMALGAANAQVVRMVASEAAGLIVIGIVFGGVLAFATTRLVKSLLYGVTPTDPMTFGVSALLLAVVAMLAAFVPAARAARQDPVDALRGD